MAYQVIMKKYQGSHPAAEEIRALEFNGEKEVIMNFRNFPVQVKCTRNSEGNEENYRIQAEMTGQMEEPLSVSLEYVQDNWTRSEYVFFPAAVYDGNRMDSVYIPYPPYHDGKKGDEWAQVITNIPRLSNEKEESDIQFRSGDMSTPAMGYFSDEKKEGLLVLAPHYVSEQYTGFSVFEKGNEAAFRVSLPAVRENKKYFFGDLPDGSGFYPTMEMESDDEGIVLKKGECLEFEVKVLHIQAEDRIDYIRQFNELREKVETGSDYASIPFSTAYNAVKDKYIEHNFVEEEAGSGYYRVGSGNVSIPSYWQAGWVGGGMNTYSFLMEDDGIAREHSLKTLKFIADKLQFENGWYVSMYAHGKKYGDAFTDDNTPVLLVRKDADLLYFLMKQAFVLKDAGEKVEGLDEGIRRQADAFVRFVKKNGELGQFINMETEEILAGGTASAGITPGALALAYEYFGDKEYLEIAELLGDIYVKSLEKGIMNGGPGEICQASDSESAFGSLEGFVQLYETTGKEKWLEAAERAFELAITWVMSYDFHMPEGTMADKMKAHTMGTVFANAQNKHSAPGICTLSGNSMLKLYRFTGNEKYLTWMGRISHALAQFVSLPDRPIETLQGKDLNPGWYNERVQTCDWEGKETIGGFLYGSNWPEVTMLLTYAEVPGIYVDMENQKVFCSDHMETACEWENDGTGKLTVKNPTEYDAVVTVLVDKDRDEKLGTGYFGKMQKISVAAHSQIEQNIAI